MNFDKLYAYGKNVLVEPIPEAPAVTDLGIHTAPSEKTDKPYRVGKVLSSANADALEEADNQWTIDNDEIVYFKPFGYEEFRNGSQVLLFVPLENIIGYENPNDDDEDEE